MDAQLDVHAWKAARPAARRVRRRAALFAAVTGLLAVTASVLADNVLLLLALPVLTWAGWRLARRVLATHAVRAVLPRTGDLPAVAVAELVARGSTVVRGSRVVAVEDDRSVTLTTTAGPAPGPDLPLSVITQLGAGGGGG